MAIGTYIHVPFCNSRCGYCDFNTYTATELGGGGDMAAFPSILGLEVDAYAETMGTIDTVFVGGGTPTMLPVEDLVGILDHLRSVAELNPTAEITTECNPDSVDATYLEALREGGFNRLSIGMQSASSRVLNILDRTHTPGRSLATARIARDVGFEHVSLDLIFGTPGETQAELIDSVEQAIDSGVDHISAYSLIVEPGTRLAAQVARGELASPDDDVMADSYLVIDDLLTEAGFAWYEVSNWAKSDGECRHNIGYWRSDDWYGFGPGAHSHVGGRRWWNVKHPSRYAAMLQQDELPIADEERLTAEQQGTEDIMLRLRLREGLALAGLSDWQNELVDTFVARGLLDADARATQRLVLTRSGRLLADAVIRDLVTSPSGY